MAIDFRNVIMSSEDTEMLELNQNQKSDKAPFIICADLECIIKKIDDVRIILKIGKKFLKITSVSEHIPSGYSMSTILSFRSIENEHDVYRGNKCMKKFYEPLREDAMKIIICKKKMRLLIKLYQESYKNAKICYICKEKLKINI